jgi:hypothetical protein
MPHDALCADWARSELTHTHPPLHPTYSVVNTMRLSANILPLNLVVLFAYINDADSVADLLELHPAQRFC